MIGSYNIEIDVTIIFKFVCFRKPLFCQSRIIILVYGSARISVEVHRSLSNDKDYIFKFKYNRASLFISIVDANLSFINVINDIKSSLMIPARTRLGEIQDYDYDGYYYINADVVSLAKVVSPRVKSASQISQIRKTVTAIIVVAIVFHSSITLGFIVA